MGSRENVLVIVSFVGEMKREGAGNGVNIMRGH